MARERKEFGPGAFDDAIIGNFFVAVSDVDVPPTGWSKMDGGFIPGGGLSIFPNLAGTYLRGGNAVALIEAGTRTHKHAWAGGSQVTGGATGSHGLSGASSTGPKQAGAVTQVEDDHDHEKAIPFTPPHSPTDHIHEHTVGTVTEPDGADHLPDSRVINWIGRQLTLNELAVFHPGVILGFFGALADIPIGWKRCNGQNGTPDLRDKLIRCGDAVTSDGADLHTSTALYTADPAGGHDHGGVTSTESATKTGLLGVLSTDLALSPHTHTASALADHSHSGSEVGNQVDLKPPYRTMLFIKKTVAADPILIDNTALGVHIFFDPAETFPGVLWLKVSGGFDTFDQKYLVGFLFGDADFGALGAVGALTHQHSVDFGTSTDGAHGHTIISVLELTLGTAGATPIPTNTHTHTLPSISGHDHPTTGSVGLTAVNVPASVVLQLFEKVL